MARRKIDLLLLDGLALGWLVGLGLKVMGLNADKSARELLSIIVRLLLISLLATIGTTVTRFTSRFLRARLVYLPGPHPLVWLVYSALNTGLGLVVGSILDVGDFSAFASLFTSGIALGCSISALPLVLSGTGSLFFDVPGRDHSHWVAFYGVLLVASIPLLVVIALFAVVAPAIPWLPLAAALSAWRLGRRRVGDLLEPFDGEDLERQDLPSRV
ncbi:MAG: hypothetical protein KDD47_25595, partial [Acidobacteria bacterium]|nr:hypothetical protein [Acidobacteriota bacterium]